MEKKNKIAPFELMDCALITLTTGKSAINLRELRDRIAEAPESSLYYHLYENMLRPGFDDPEYRNDFALWAKRALHDSRLAEKLGILDPLSCCNMDDLRGQLLDVIEDHLAEHEYVPWAKPDEEFHFLTSRVVVFDTGNRFCSLEDMAGFIARMSTSSIFYHFIEARRREPLNEDDLTAWLLQWGDETEKLRERLDRVDYYFWTLQDLRERLARAFLDCLDPGSG